MVEPLRNNRIVGVNPYYTELKGTVQRHWGNRVIGRTSPVQAYYDGFSDQSTYCWPEVIDWPWAEDEWGIAFDQSNTRGVRTRCLRLADGGEGDFWVAVPKELPSGYTRLGRCQHLPDINGEVDYIGAAPFLGCSPDTDEYSGFVPVFWRGPNGPAPYPDGYSWTPMNLNQRTYESEGPYGGFWYIVDLGIYPDIDIESYYRDTIQSHVGFRGGAFITGIRETFTGSGIPNTYGPGGAEYYVGWTDPDDPDPSVLADVNILWSTFIAGASIVDNNGPVEPAGSFPGEFPFSYRVEIPGPLHAPSTEDGKKMNYHLIVRRPSPDSGGAATGEAFLWKLGPRTNIPLWFFAASGNKCAPGGYIA